MKISFVAVVPVVAAYFATSAFAYPAKYASSDLTTRDIPVDMAIAVLARALEEGELDARRLDSLVNRAKKSHKVTHRKKAHKKKSVAGHKQHIKTGKETQLPVQAEKLEPGTGGGDYSTPYSKQEQHEQVPL